MSFHIFTEAMGKRKPFYLIQYPLNRKVFLKLFIHVQPFSLLIQRSSNRWDVGHPETGPERDGSGRNRPDAGVHAGYNKNTRRYIFCPVAVRARFEKIDIYNPDGRIIAGRNAFRGPQASSTYARKIMPRDYFFNALILSPENSLDAIPSRIRLSLFCSTA